MNRVHILIRFHYISPVEQVVDVFEKRLLLDLRVGEEEDAVHFGLGGSPHDALDVLVPLVERVAAAQLDLEQLVVGHVRRQVRHRLATGAAHAHQKGVASRLLQNAAHARYVLDGEPATKARRQRSTQELTERVFGSRNMR